MNSVITASQARRITKGRMPLVPTEYETAVKALDACCTLDETKYWSDKADALAAWAKIYQSGEVLRQAKRLKLHAFRRMGQLASDLRPRRSGGHYGMQPGPISLLKESGLSLANANAATKMAALTKREFNQVLRDPKAPTTIAVQRSRGPDPVWAEFNKHATVLRAFCRDNTPANVAAIAHSLDEIKRAKELYRDLSEWLDAFEERL